MNLEKLQLVRNAIAAAPEEKFRMDVVFAKHGNTNAESINHRDGAACIAGWTAVVHAPDEDYTGLVGAVKILELIGQEGFFMFGGDWMPRTLLENITKTDALIYLDRVLSENNVFITLED